jgi:hypothetical protein
MKKIAFYGIMLMITGLWACQSKRNLNPYPENSLDKVKGKWMVAQVLVKTSNAEGASYQPLIEDMTRFRLTMYVDFTYSIESDVPDVMQSASGTWRFEDQDKTILFDNGSGVPMRAEVLFLSRSSLDLKVQNSTYKTETRDFIFKLVPAVF